MKTTFRAAVALLLGLTASLVVVPVSAAGATERANPKEWDARIAPIVKKVEKLRGLKFDHPVPVDFLTAKAFEKKVSVDDKDLSKDDKKQLAQSTKFLRALGLVHGDLDLLDATNELSTSGTLAYYSPDDKRITIKGKKLDVETKVTVAHELTHALQDQHFDLTKLQETADEHNASAPLDALVEGDATRIENDYVDGLSKKDQDAYYGTQEPAGEVTPGAAGTSAAPDAPSDAPTNDVPQVLQILQMAPYEFGPTMVETVLAAGDEAAVNKLFTTPPTTEQQFVNPITLLRHEAGKKVSTPKLAKGEKQIRKPDPFGAFGLYLMLASRIDPLVALHAVDAWGGDAERVYEKKVDGKKTVCVRADFTGRSRSDTDVIENALQLWAAAMPAGSAKVTAKGSLVELVSCDPGADAPAAPNDLEIPTALALFRAEFEQQALDHGLPKDDAECVGDTYVYSPSLLSWLRSIGDTEPTDAQYQQIQDLQIAALDHCGYGVG